MPETQADGRIYTVETLTEAPVAGDRNTIGGWPVLPGGEWPACFCGTPMVFFFQLDIPGDVPVFGGAHLLVFQCPEHDDPAFGPVQLPDRYWDAVTEPYEGRFWRFFLHTAGTPSAEADPLVDPRRLALHPAEEQVSEYGRGVAGFKVGGVPSWAQDPEHYRCSCGTDMTFLCQVPENFGFDMWPMRDRDNQAQLFLGNEVYIFACPARCHPQALWPAIQN
ncbi:hypothetical protein KOI35_38475 [Actinoplanes bogorensis]|uniref:DUF1963 domain-containing protein n=1 Tax=Paractinoplanes bogorensis TaxID=1610840 RepID=A0ABS5Z141_9ACTN|nr:hypothetical protein [Actinoplanes bogorensis]MBU2669415.1 hypothetical protein [Actinoplanes bogorensis]